MDTQLISYSEMFPNPEVPDQSITWLSYELVSI